MKKKKKPSLTSEVLLHDIESELSLTIEKLVTKCLITLKKLLLREKSNSLKITPNTLKNKEQWWDKDALGYSLTSNKEVYLEKFDLNRNTFICATTGAGKNVCLDEIVEDRIKNGHVVLYISPKGDRKDIENFKNISNKYGVKARVFSADDETTVSYNPLEFGDLTRITERVFNSFTWSEQYYANCNYMAIQGAVSNILKDSARGVVTIGGLLKEIVENFNSKETQDIISKLSKLHLSQAGKILEKSDDIPHVSISSLKENKESLILSLSTLGMPTISRQVGKMLVYDLMNHAYELYRDGVDSSSKDLVKITLVVDEFGSIATHDIINLINKGRGSGIGVCASTQTLADMDHLGNDFKNQFIGNCQNFFVGKSINPNEADYWAKFFGTNSIEKMTMQTEYGEEGDRGSVRLANEYKIDPNTIRDLGIGQFVLCSHMPIWFLDVVKIHLNDRHTTLEKKLTNKKALSPSVKRKRKALGSINFAERHDIKKEIGVNRATGKMGHIRTD